MAGYLLTFEKITALEVPVAIGFAGADRRGFDACFHVTGRRVRRIELDRARDMAELALHVGDHHVPHFEVRAGVLRIDLIGNHALIHVIPVSGPGRIRHQTKYLGSLRTLGSDDALDELPGDHQLQPRNVDRRNPDSRAVA